MPRKSFMGQRCKKLQIGPAARTVDVDHIRTACIQWRCEIKCRTQKILHGFVNIADLIIGGIKSRKILLHLLVQILKGRRRFKIFYFCNIREFSKE